ncbi:FMN-dependent oxidoreductase (nitrilotriacetate monooxygenase family) [Humitalea rosea]|uniref:FMN-dependent oxidoreductase (Nitrilotriacetate monooxygenase family) n=1 Tax=Humitalea rosea TaxID=990373 RepID=A0A2W7JRY1_9PROT|nr:LLM class flavin-dependent oxidoreductase [Humitalea rosea]PZW37696.1 FMN-dependent oxidoreductase (nitrilotriacetate monooxygenase family) [Humitalea rosea]
MTAKRQMKLGMSMRGLGYHAAAWRHPGVPADGTLRFEHYVRNAQTAERGLFDMIFFADGIGIREKDEPRGSLERSGYEIVEMEPMTLLPALAALTSRIGLVTTASTTYNEPYHIARKFATLDLISGGRAGWNIVTSWSDAEARNFNRAKHLDYDTRYERAVEFVEVVTGLWDSWEPDAFVYDKAHSVFYNPGKMHLLEHRGVHFQVLGPLNVASMPQGRPILVQAGASEPGREIAARSADVVYAAQDTIAAARAYYGDVKGRMAKYGRERDDLKIMPALRPVVGRTRAEAQAKFDELQALVDPLVGLARVYNELGDLSGFPLDGPVPEPQIEAQVRSGVARIMARVRANNWTIRELCQQQVGAGGFCVIGTATDIADVMEDWIDTGAADGFNITPTHLPAGCEDFVELVTPELQRRGRLRTAYEGATLRENLGLKPHVNRYVAAREGAARSAAE